MRVEKKSVLGRGMVAIATLLAVVGSVLAPVTSASAATYTITAARVNSGTTAADAASTCLPQGSTPEAHCAGFDTSLLATDQILRSGDSADVRFDFAFSGSDTGVVLRSTLPLVDGEAVGIWTAIPAACAAGSSRTDANRTLNCLIANPQGAGDGSVTARFRLEGYAADGYTFTVPATIESATSTPVAAASTATFTASNAPLWSVTKNNIANIIPAPFYYRSPEGEGGFAVPLSTGVVSTRLGGYSELAAPVTWQESVTSGTVDTTGYRLLNWGNYGDGCASQNTAATPANPGYTSTVVNVTNQYGPVVTGAFDCSQPGGPGTPVTVQWNNPTALTNGRAANAWIMVWVPAEDVPVGRHTLTNVSSGFDPVDVHGVSNFFGGTEPAGADNTRTTAQIVNEDNRSITRVVTSAVSALSNPAPGGVNPVSRLSVFASNLRFQNTGTVPQAPLQLCEVFDNTTQRIAPLPTGNGVSAGTYAVAVTSGPLNDPILAPPYQPAPGYNNTNNFAVDPGSYVVEFAAGPLTDTVPETAPLPASEFATVGCGDADVVGGGWYTDPNDPDLVAYAQSLGLTDTRDVINRVRITFTGDAFLQPGSFVAAKIGLQAREVYRPGTTQAGSVIFATTQLGGVGAFNYPQNTVAPWTATPYGGPVVAGRINVDTNVTISGNPTTVQAGAPGQNRTTYTVTPSIAFGENVATSQPLRVAQLLPYGIRYVAGTATVAPDHVLPQADGSTVLVWDFGVITGTTNGVTTLPAFSFQGEADPLAPTPDVNYTTIVSESVSPTGQQIDLDLPVINCVADNQWLNVDVPPTPTVPVATQVQLPPERDYTGCENQLRFRRMDWQPITIGNAFLDLAASKAALDLQIESGADDRIDGETVGWNLVYANRTSNTFDGVDIIDVLPFNGDGREPASDLAGEIHLTSLETSDMLSNVPNALPVSSTEFTPRAGTTFYVTSRPAAEIDRDPYAASNLQGGATTWCLLTQVGTAGCPTLAEVTAFRAISGSLASQAERSIRIGIATDALEDGDLLNNTANARAIGLTTPVEISGDAITVVASQIEGTVWSDANGDGVIDEGEGGLAGVDVTLNGTAANGESVSRSAATDADGDYQFLGLGQGDYTITVDQADVRALNPAYALTSDPDGLTDPDGSAVIELGLNTTVAAQDFGFATSSLSGTVFSDDDNDGVIDAGEDGVADVTVTLTGTDDLGASVSRIATTDDDGAYSFGDVRPGDYTLTKTQPEGTLAGRNVAGTAGGTAGPVGSNVIAEIGLDPAEQGVDYLFAELIPEIVSGVVFVDADNDGVQDEGEAGIGGVPVTLTGEDAGGAVERSAVTFNDGTFTFASLRPGTYQLTEQQPEGYLDGLAATNGSVGTVDGDTISGIVVDGTGETDGYAFGELLAASLAGAVFEDLDADGVRDADEPGIANVTVQLTGTDDIGSTPTELNQTATTDADGDYEFLGLRPGNYAVTQTQPEGYLDGREIAGGAGGVVGDAVGANVISGIPVTAGDEVTGYLFGDVRAASVEATVYVDSDNDGTRDAGENGIVGASLTLTGTDDFGQAVNATLTTVADGLAAFTGLRPGTYTVTETQPAGYFDGLDAAGSAGGTVGADSIAGILLGSGAVATGYLFGERAPAGLSGTVFADLDGDELLDAGEAGIEGVAVELLDAASAVLDTTTTDADGAWEFADLAPGTYGVREVQPAGHIGDAAVPGTAGGTAGENTVTGIELTTDAAGYLFPDIPLAAIRGSVWHDADDDGVRDAEEAGIGGVEITLGGAADLTTTTVADGSFVFAGLVPGTYTLTETQPESWSDGRTAIGVAGGEASENTITGIVLTPGADASGYGFGEREAELQLFAEVQTLDAPVEPGPTVLVGSPVRFTYTVVNNGDTALGAVTVGDQELGTAECEAEEIAAGDSIECTLTTESVAGQQAHTVTAEAVVLPPGEGPFAAEVTEVSATDTVHYFGMVATATITATVNGEDATSAPGPVLENDEAAEVVVTITNTGNVPLSLDVLDGGALGEFDCASYEPLQPGESVECVLTGTLDAGNQVFTVIADLLAPPSVGVDGVFAETVVSAETGVFFQVAEPGVTPPPPTTQDPDLAGTGLEVGAAWIAAALALLALGGVLVARRRVAE